MSTATLPPPVSPPPRDISGTVPLSGALDECLLFTESLMEEVAAIDFAGGTCVVFSTRSPQKSTPNEDAAALVPVGASGGVLIVADGLGGHAGGERAARLAVETIRDAVADCEASDDQLRPAILDGIEAANQAVMQMGTGAATTLALVEVADGTVRPYHVGDSAILLTGQRGKVKLQTIAHSPIGYAIEAGLIDEVDAMLHEERHMISNVMGSDQMRIEIGPAIPMAPRDTLLLASDGLLDNLLPQEIVDQIRTGSLRETVEELIGEARRRMEKPKEGAPSKPDDLTVIAFRCS